jgi:iron complex transport system substrate-binding protein
MRIASLLASGTEIVCALGAGDALVGRSHECDNPEWVRHLPACTKPAFDVSLPSGQIDAEVKRRIRAGEPLYHVDTELLDRLAADLLITQIHCDVCAVTPADVERSGGSTRRREVISLAAGSVDGIYDGIRAVAAALNRTNNGEELISSLRRRFCDVSNRVRQWPAPTVVVLEWIDPVFATGNWVPELVSAAGGTSLLGEARHHSSTVPWQQVVDADPDYLVVAPCGFDLERTLGEAATLEALPHWYDLQAVRAGRVAVADGNKYFNRSGVTIADTAEILVEILHPDLAEARWLGTAWLWYPGSGSVNRSEAG